MKTDNDNIDKKIKLRLVAVNNVAKDNILILDCYHGFGVLWGNVQKHTEKKIKVIGIEKEWGKGDAAFHGDNEKFLPSIDLSIYDIIDLDAYGIPFDQLEILFQRKYRGIVVCTFIQSIFGNLPGDFLSKLGYTEKMFNKIKSIFTKNSFDKLKNYLYLYGIEELMFYKCQRKLYFYFKI
jgi:hypothetical protein